MQVTTEKYNPLPMLWKPPPPSLRAIGDTPIANIYKIYIDPKAVIDRVESPEMYRRAKRIYRVRPDVYLCDPRLFVEGLVD